MRPTPAKPVEPVQESTAATFADDVEQRIAADPIASAMDKRNRREQAARILAEQAATDGQSTGPGAKRTGPWLPEGTSISPFSLLREEGFTTYNAGVVEADDGAWMQYGQATYHRSDSLYAPTRSVLGDAYRFSANEALSSDNSFGVRVGYGASAVVLALPGLVNDAARNVLNAPSRMYVGAQTMNVGWQARDPLHFSNGLMDFSTGLLDVAGAASITKAGIVRNNELAAYSARQEYARITYNFRDGIESHMTKFDGFSQAKGISGTHNLDEFMKAASNYDVKIVGQTQLAEGIAHIEYQIPKLDPAKNVMRDSSGNVLYKGGFEKTVYDPRVYSDAQMAALGQQAAVNGYKAAMAAGKGQYSATAGGVQFQVYLDPKTGIVRNYHPQ
ncbi:CdiA family toxin C-terminal domain-containing protein [Pseudoduganella sp. R-34]|uniref:CdiA family toxin C-terminal domain-containing protein n=1 Tax=Pseudoduganella sp. R-34 TaxID=3404062 RepID=UPI003CF06ACD